jgi:hypothetical protein
MAATFPTALQRTSDERWVTLELLAHDGPRGIARIAEEPQQTAVLRLDAGDGYDAHLRALLADPPPDPGPHVALTWPVDLLHDLDGRVRGYTARRTASAGSVPLADLADPARRVQVAPGATRRHLVRVARSTATAVAALHHAGYAGVRTDMVRVDDAARAILVRLDELVPAGGTAAVAEDRARLADLVRRLLAGQPWALGGELGPLLRAGARSGHEAPTAADWFHALRDAEHRLAELRLPAAPAPAPAPAPVGHVRDRARSAPDLEHVGVRAAPASTSASGARRAGGPRPPARPGRRPERGRALRATPVPGRGDPARAATTLATGLVGGVLASVAPFAAFGAVVAALVLGRAVDVGVRKGSRGPHQVLAIVASRLVPFATGGLALGAFILLDLLLLLGLCMAVARLLFDYGPGFTLTWVLQLPEVPGLVRAFAFAVGAAGGLSAGAHLHDRARAVGAAGGRLVVPAVGLAAAVAALLLDAGPVWWPLPLGPA